MSLEDGALALTGTDTEVEIRRLVAVAGAMENGPVTVPTRKLTDICK